MALNREQMGLLFQLDADAKQAKAEVAAFKEFMAGVLEGIQAEAKEAGKATTKAFDDIGDHAEKLDKKFDGAGKKGADSLDKLGKSSKASAKIVKESVETISSELIESFGIDGDIANTLGQQISGLSNKTLLYGGVLVGLTAIAAGTAVALFSLAKGTAETLTEIGDLNEKTGVSVETLSALKPTLEQNGASLKQFGGAMGELEQKLLKARDGNKEFADGFRKLGVDITQGVEPALAQIVKKYNELPEGAERTAFATNVFGQAGEDLVLTLNSLNGNLDAHTAKMRELGLVVTPQAVEEAKRFDDQMKQMDLQMRATQQTIGGLVIPTFTGLLTVLNGVFKSMLDVINGSRGLGSALASAAGFASLGGSFGALGLATGKSDRQKNDEDTANALAIEEELQRRQDGTSGNPTPFGDKKKTGGKAPSAAAVDQVSQARLQQLRVAEQAAQREADTEINAARRAFQEREITIQQLERLVIETENRMMAVKEATFAEERRIIEESTARQLTQAKLTARQREQIQEQSKAKLAELAEREASATQRSSDNITRIATERAKIEEDILRAGFKARSQMSEEALRAEQQRIKVAADQRIISEETAARRIAEVERSIFDERRARLGQEAAFAGQDPKELQRINNEIVKLAQERAIAEEQAQTRIVEAQRRDLANLRAYLQERNRLLEELQRGQIDALNRRAETLERRAQDSPQFQAQARAARTEALLAEEEFQNRLNESRIRTDQQRAEAEATTNAQRLEARKLANQLLEQEEQRHKEATGQITNQNRVGELQQQGFEPGMAETIAQQEQLVGRQLSLMELLRLNASQLAADLQATVEPIGAIFLRMQSAVSTALANTVAAFVSGKASIRQAAAALFQAALQPLKDYLLKKSKAQFALGLAEAAMLNFGGAAKHFLAGVALAAAAGLIDVGGSAIAGSGAGGGAAAPSAGGGNSNDRGNDKRVIDQGGPLRDQKQQVIVIRTEVGEGTVVKHWLEDFRGNGVTRSAARRDLLNET